jgi:chloramphenicol-sensitive protein RarD
MYYKLLSHVPPLELLAHRTVWSLVFFAAILALQGRLIGLLHAVSTSLRLSVVVMVSALMIALNWYFFIYAIQIHQAMQGSLGYYIFPLVAILLGRIFFQEHLGIAQIIAIILALVGVLILAVGVGHVPWISLILAASFGVYGIVKKGLALGPIQSVTAEVFFLAPIAVWVIILAQSGSEGAFNMGTSTIALLLFSGPLTATPLILFSYAARRVALGTVGVLQYLNPTLQFLCAAIVFGEPFGLGRAVAFGFIWAAVTLYCYAILKRG